MSVARRVIRTHHISSPRTKPQKFLKIPHCKPLINEEGRKERKGGGLGKAELPSYLIDTIKIVNSKSAIVSERAAYTHLSQCR